MTGSSCLLYLALRGWERAPAAFCLVDGGSEDSRVTEAGIACAVRESNP